MVPVLIIPINFKLRPEGASQDGAHHVWQTAADGFKASLVATFDLDQALIWGYPNCSSDIFKLQE